MNHIDIEYLQEQTRIIKPIQIPIKNKKTSQVLFSAVFCDLDNPEITNVQEGTLKTEGLEVDPEIIQRIISESFGAQGWEIAQENLPKIKLGEVALQANQCSRHIMHEREENVIDRVKRTNQQRLIIRTEESGWQLGLLLSVIPLLEPQ